MSQNAGDSERDIFLYLDFTEHFYRCVRTSPLNYLSIYYTFCFSMVDLKQCSDCSVYSVEYYVV
jgi:hypothetical protein